MIAYREAGLTTSRPARTGFIEATPGNQGRFGSVSFFGKRQHPGQFPDHVDQLGIGRNNDLGIAGKGSFHRLQLAQQLSVANKILFSSFIDELDRLCFAFRCKEPV